MFIILLFFFLHWYLSLFFQTFFLHRYASHRMFEMSKITERIFYIMTFIAQGSSYLSPRAYAIMHRMHHDHTDTEHDPHSPSNDGNLMNMMWKTFLFYTAIYKGEADIPAKYTKNLPNWDSFDRFACSLGARTMWGVGYAAFYYFFAPSPWFYVLVPIHILMGPVHGAIINWFSHKYGYINFRMENTSTNLMKIDWLMMGEGLHNNHHKFPSRAKFSVKKFEFDPAYPWIFMMEKLGIIRLRGAI